MTVRYRPDLEAERLAQSSGYEQVAGVDEVGRGCLAGPVVAAAVVLPSAVSPSVAGLIDDSKRLSPAQRERANRAIFEEAAAVGVGACEASEIDALGIANATKSAMRKAVDASGSRPDFLLVDAVGDLDVAQSHRAIIKGDSKSLSIAAASIVAKVFRDRMMATKFESAYPDFGFARHKGYGTSQHIDALQRHGPTPIHRKTFRPVSQTLLGGEFARSERERTDRRRVANTCITGRRGESLAAERLTEAGYDVIERNRRTSLGEIDLVAIEGGDIVFVEVKTCRDKTDADLDRSMGCTPIDCMNARKIRQTFRCADAYISEFGSHGRDNWRIDFVGVELGAGHRPARFKIIRNVEPV